jgi:hypothetical protein
MNRQSGFVIATWMYVVGAIAILGLLSGMAYMVKSYLDGVDKKAFDRGIAEEKARWQGRESKELADANLKISSLNDAYREREAAFALEINGLAAKHEEGKRNAKAIHDRDVAAVRAGFRLRDNARSAAPCEGSGGGAAPTAVAATGKPDGAGGGELSEEATGFLLSEANRADAVVETLGKLQDLALSYWKECSGAKKTPVETGVLSEPFVRPENYAGLRDWLGTSSTERLDFFLPLDFAATMVPAAAVGGFSE